MAEFGLGPGSQNSYWKPFLFALVLIAIIAVGFFYLNPRKNATLTVVGTQIYAAHTTFTNDDDNPHVIGVPAHTEDDLYTVINLSIRDNLRFPFRIDDVIATYTAADGSSIEAYAPGASTLSQLEQVFPALTPMIVNPLNDNTDIAPGATVQGAVVVHFPGVTEAEWKARKSATLTVNLVQQPPVTATIP